ncbi:MAG TPA: hypothetical protein VKB72_15235 [Steroidobacteraceae bacterium]|nr:hypothetical protein [Steroidobacteraceae bacterium]
MQHARVKAYDRPEVIDMVKNFLIGSSLALALAALSACATSPSAGMAQAKNETGPPAGCVSDNTASRLPPSGPCAGVGGSHTQGDLNRTGQQQNNPAKALQMVDPSIHP